jgi:probable HAF family extracellular repeat protein
MTARFRSTLVLLGAVPILGACSERYAVADAITYSATELGRVADTDVNYLNALSVGDQAAFRAGSFDHWAHPSPYPADLGGFTWAGVQRLSTTAVSANDLGQAVGVAWPDNALAFEYDPTQRALPSQTSPPGITGLLSPVLVVNTVSEAIAINDNGQIIGGSTPGWNLGYHGGDTWMFLVGPRGSITWLGDLGSGYGGYPLALNNSGQVVGSSLTAANAQHAFLYSNGALQDLNNLIPTTAGLTLTEAVGIDASGRIVAFGTGAVGKTHEYLLAPATVPEPGTLLIACLMGAAGLAHSRRLRRTA